MDCFEFDWSNVKQLKYKKSTEEEVKAAMKQGYLMIKEFYKVQSGYGRIGIIFSVALNQFTEFIKEHINLIDGQHLNMSDADRFFITVNAGKKGALIPANALIRFQFVEILLRMALRKYLESGEALNEAQAVEMLIDYNIRPAYYNFQTAHEYRKEVIWREPVDNILKAHLPVFKHLYDLFGGTELLPGQKMFMSVSEFENFILAVPLVNDIFMQRDASVCFSLAMMTQVNDIDYERHIQGQFIEFLEAFCRAADRAAFQPVDDDGIMSVEERKRQPLHIKIENVLPMVIRLATSGKKPLHFKLPLKDPDVGLYLLPNGKYF